MRAWTYCSSKSTKKISSKDELEGSEIEKETSCTQAPLGSTSNTQLELPLAKKRHDHVFLHVKQRAAEKIDSESKKEEDSRFLESHHP